MGDPKWTPGPWFQVDSETGALHEDGLDIGSGRDPHEGKHVACCEPYSDYDESIANARLMSASPDLFSALDNLLGVIETDALIPESVGYMKDARAAIAKALGET